ncbi:MAG: hypothetical protein CHACPFDD_00744 [Phycisphaerae bacterium]|nr:hypothetical protein [Phycisphaerae bacterium]
MERSRNCAADAFNGTRIGQCAAGLVLVALVSAPAAHGELITQAVPPDVVRQQLYFVQQPDGSLVPADGSTAHSPLAYSDTATAGTYFPDLAPRAATHQVGDDIHTGLPGPFAITDLSFGYFLPGGATHAIVRFWANDGDDSIAPGFAGGGGASFASIVAPNLTAGAFLVHIDLAAPVLSPPDLWMSVDLSNPEAGLLITDNPIIRPGSDDVGSSDDLFAWDGDVDPAYAPGIYDFDSQHSDFVMQVGLPEPSSLALAALALAALRRKARRP